MGDVRMKIFHCFCRSGDDGTRDVISRFGGVADCVRHFLRAPGVGGCLRAKASIRCLDWHDGGVLDVAPLLGALCLETRLAPRCSPSVSATVLFLIISGAMYVHRRCIQDGAFSERIASCHSSFTFYQAIRMDGASTRETLWKLLVFGALCQFRIGSFEL